MSKNSDKYKAPGTPKPKPETKKPSADEDFLEIPAAYDSSSAPSLKIAIAKSASFDEEDWADASGSIHHPSPVTPKNATSSDINNIEISMAFSGEGSHT